MKTVVNWNGYIGEENEIRQENLNENERGSEREKGEMLSI